jgi:NAD-dependent dihydropyrimidine dehydrogenase PreA subunit
MRTGDIEIDLKHCNGCGKCYDTCPQDVFGWNNDEGMPTIDFADECWYCGVCRTECDQLAITVHTPFQQKFFWGIFSKEGSSKNK